MKMPNTNIEKNPNLSQSNEELSSIKSELENLKKSFAEIEETARKRKVKKGNRDSFREIKQTAKKEKKSLETMIYRAESLEKSETINTSTNLLAELQDGIKKKTQAKEELLRQMGQASSGKEVSGAVGTDKPNRRTNKEIRNEKETLSENREKTALKTELTRLKLENEQSKKVQDYLDGIINGTVKVPLNYTVLVKNLGENNMKKIRKHDIQAYYHLTGGTGPGLENYHRGTNTAKRRIPQQGSYVDTAEAYNKNGLKGTLRHALNQTNMNPRQREGWIKAVEMGSVGAALFFGIKWLFSGKDQDGKGMSWWQKGLAIAGVTMGSHALTGKNPLQLIGDLWNKGLSVDNLWGGYSDFVDTKKTDEVPYGNSFTFAGPLFGGYKFKELGSKIGWSDGKLSIDGYEGLQETAKNNNNPLLRKAGETPEPEANKKLQKALSELGIDENNYDDVTQKLEDKKLEDVIKDHEEFNRKFTEYTENNSYTFKDSYNTSKEYKLYLLNLIIAGKTNITDEEIQDHISENPDKFTIDETITKNLDNIDVGSSGINLTKKINDLDLSQSDKIKIMQGLSEVYDKTPNTLEITEFNYPIMKLKSYGQETLINFAAKRIGGDVEGETVVFDLRFQDYAELIKVANLTNFIHDLFKDKKDDAQNGDYFHVSGFGNLTFNDKKWYEPSTDTKVATIGEISKQLNTSKNKELYAEYLNKIIFNTQNENSYAISLGRGAVAGAVAGSGSNSAERTQAEAEKEQSKLEQKGADIKKWIEDVTRNTNIDVEYDKDKNVVITNLTWEDMKNDDLVTYLDDLSASKINVQGVDFNDTNKITLTKLNNLLDVGDKLKLGAKFNGDREMLRYVVDNSKLSHNEDKTFAEIKTEYETLTQAKLEKLKKEFVDKINRGNSLGLTVNEINYDENTKILEIKKNMGSYNSQLIDNLEELVNKNWLFDKVEKISIQYPKIKNSVAQLKRMLDASDDGVIFKGEFADNLDTIKKYLSEYDGNKSGIKILSDIQTEYNDQMKTKLENLKESFEKQLKIGLDSSLDNSLSVDYDQKEKSYKITGLDTATIQNDKLIANLKGLMNQRKIFLPEYIEKVEIPGISMAPGKYMSVKYIEDILDLGNEVVLSGDFAANRDMIKYVVGKFDAGNYYNKENTKLDLNSVILLQEIYRNNYDFVKIGDGEDDSRADFVKKVSEILKDKNINLDPARDNIQEWGILEKLYIEYSVKYNAKVLEETGNNDDILQKIEDNLK